MDKRSKPCGGQVRRRIVLQSAAALTIGGPAVLGGRAGAQPRTNAPPGKALFVYVGAFTMPERKGKGDGINVYRMDPSSGVWTHLQLVPNVGNPSFLALDREQAVSLRGPRRSGRGQRLCDRQANRSAGAAQPPILRWQEPGSSGGRPGESFHRHGELRRRIGRGRTDREGRHPRGTDRFGDVARRTRPHRKEQASSHPHDCPFDPAGRLPLVPDKRLDRVFSFKLDSANGKLTTRS